jgi:integrase
MARMVRNAKVDTRSARAKLAPRREPYWCKLAPGRHLGYRRLGAQGGTWIAKLRIPGVDRWTRSLDAAADDVLDANGNTILTFAQAQEKARAWFLEQEHQATADGPAEQEEAPPTYTVADAITAYERWLSKHRKPTAVRDLRAANRAHIEPALGKVELGELTSTKLRNWHEGLAEKPRRLRTGRGAKEQRYRPIADDPESIRRRRDTANRIRTILFAALNRAFEDGKVASDAAWRKVKPFRETGSARVRYLSLDECKRLMNACEPDFRKLVRGALVTGCRYGELCRADVSDFNADASTLLVRESKGGKPRWVPLDDAGAAFLATVTAGRSPSAPLFARSDGERWGPSHQTRPLIAACAAAKLEPCGFHTLRHTYASHRVMAGMPLIAVANVLGHGDTRMVEKHYGHLSPSYIREAVRATALDLGPVEGNVKALRPAAG